MSRRLRHKFHRKQVVELQYFEELIKKLKGWGREEVLAEVKHKEFSFPLKVFHLGTEDKKAPVLLLTGAVHGLEKIGSDVILSYLETLAEILNWDQNYQKRLANSRIIFFPVVNPFGVFYRTRCNANGVDLMRNAPIEAEGDVRHLYSGQSISPRLPWYRGNPQQMEVESQALIQLVRESLFDAEISIAIDLHSGFGRKDRLWFPFAHSRTPFPFLAELFKVKGLYDKAYANHVYEIEPVSAQYTIHGDLWDYLMEEFMKEQTSKSNKIFIPITLEMGSWTWIRKNPAQLFWKHGLFHPVQAHRYRRIMRRHKGLFNFVHRLLLSPAAWTQMSIEERERNLSQALKMWY